MSAIVCGKRSFFDDLQSPSPTASSPPAAKKHRCISSASPVRFLHSPPQQPPLIDRLMAAFPDMEKELLEKALEEFGHDLDSAIKSLNKLRLGYVEGELHSVVEAHARGKNGISSSDEGVSVAPEDASTQSNIPVDGAEWVELFVREMMSATSIDDARSRASRVLESLERSISARVGAEAAESFTKENTMLKEQIEVFLRENSILKRAVAIQHERQKEYDDRNQEVQQLKQLVAQYQQQLRTLEVNNYALTMHLRQAQQGNSIPGRFHPDVF
ncbi:unnamed protein product [Coffea canephora]|uniref:CUE domain-containing protein n=1 Tax=Coffea canephora TaxID=49390 RepID=A0A068TPJ7_COFCA|nr:uncharacterized protein LOC113768172 [Coffea eugenioides]CDO98166.1 unnamed protein product [Coffea canephora]